LVEGHIPSLPLPAIMRFLSLLAFSVLALAFLASIAEAAGCNCPSGQMCDNNGYCQQCQGGYISSGGSSTQCTICPAVRPSLLLPIANKVLTARTLLLEMAHLAVHPVQQEADLVPDRENANNAKMGCTLPPEKDVWPAPVDISVKEGRVAVPPVDREHSPTPPGRTAKNVPPGSFRINPVRRPVRNVPRGTLPVRARAPAVPSVQ
jgi:hypothetical protein